MSRIVGIKINWAVAPKMIAIYHSTNKEHWMLTEEWGPIERFDNDGDRLKG